MADRYKSEPENKDNLKATFLLFTRASAIWAIAPSDTADGTITYGGSQGHTWLSLFVCETRHLSLNRSLRNSAGTSQKCAWGRDMEALLLRTVALVKANVCETWAGSAFICEDKIVR